MNGQCVLILQRVVVFYICWRKNVNGLKRILEIGLKMTPPIQLMIIIIIIIPDKIAVVAVLLFQAVAYRACVCLTKCDAHRKKKKHEIGSLALVLCRCHRLNRILFILSYLYFVKYVVNIVIACVLCGLWHAKRLRNSNSLNSISSFCF